MYAKNNTNIQMNGQFNGKYFTNEFYSSLKICQTTDHSVYEFNIHFLNTSNFLTIEMLCIKDYQQNLYKYAELLSKAWSKNLTCNQINISLILMRLT